MAKNSKPSTDPAASQEQETELADPKSDEEVQSARDADHAAEQDKASKEKDAKEKDALQVGNEQAIQEAVRAAVASGFSVHRFALKQPRKLGEENYLRGDIVGELRLPPGVTPNFFVDAVRNDLLTEVGVD